MERTRARLVTVAVLVLVFFSGLLLGIAVDSRLTATAAEPTASAESEDDSKKERRRAVYHQVGPDAAQQVLIDSIVVVHRHRMDALHEEFRSQYNPRYDAVIHETREAIKAVLSPEQAAEYQRLLDERDRRRAEERAKKDDRD